MLVTYDASKKELAGRDISLRLMTILNMFSHLIGDMVILP